MKKYWIVLLNCLTFTLSSGTVMADRTSAQVPSKTGDQRTREPISVGKRIEPRGERDPFGLPPGVHHPSSAPKSFSSKADEEPKEIPLALLEVKAILISNRIRLASIDHQIVTVGDLIHDERVFEIQRDRVVIGKGDKKRTLFLKQSPIRLTIEEGEKKGGNR